MKKKERRNETEIIHLKIKCLTYSVYQIPMKNSITIHILNLSYFVSIFNRYFQGYCHIFYVEFLYLLIFICVLLHILCNGSTFKKKSSNETKSSRLLKVFRAIFLPFLSINISNEMLDIMCMLFIHK